MFKMHENTQTGASFVAATGGTITCSGDYKVHTFTGPGTFVFHQCWWSTSSTAGYVVVVGGGASGGAHNGGGGAEWSWRIKIFRSCHWPLHCSFTKCRHNNM